MPCDVEATSAALKKSAEEDLARMKNNYFISLGHYLKYSKQDPTSNAAKHAFEVSKRNEQLMKDAEHVLKMLQSLDGSASCSPSVRFFLACSDSRLPPRKSLQVNPY